MLRVGLTGGLASGKSFVGHALRDLGCHLIEADELGHQVLLPGAEAYGAVVNAFGDDILDQDRFIDRHKLELLLSPATPSDTRRVFQFSLFAAMTMFEFERVERTLLAQDPV